MENNKFIKYEDLEKASDEKTVIDIKFIENKLQELRNDKEKIENDLEKYFFTEKGDTTEKIFTNAKDKEDYEDLTSRRNKLEDKIKEWEGKLISFKN